MNTAGKFLALALQAYQSRQFEEAGCLFAQAAECSDVAKLTDALLQPVTDHVPGSQQPILDSNTQQLSGDESESEEDWGEEDEADADADEEAEDVEETEDVPGDESTSSGAVLAPTRRKVTSMYQIGKILAASMEATSSEEEVTTTDDAEDEDAEASTEDDDTMPEPDPDIPGEALVPASFSSVTLKGFAVTSPVKLKK